MSPACDWYQATIKSDGRLLRDVLAAEYEGARFDPTSPRLGYGSGYVVIDALGKRATVMEGGRNIWPNVTFSGQDGPGGMQLLRGAIPQHEVTRFDAKVDFEGRGAWDQSVAALYRVADQHKVTVRMDGDWRPGRGESGRTLYLGSKKSAVVVRLYEKGKERRARGDLTVPEGVIRLEVMARPKDSARTRAASMEPAEAFGMARFSAAAYRAITGFEVRETSIRDLRQSDDRRAFAWMAEQYGPAIDRLTDRMGGWEQLEALLRMELGAARARKRTQ